MRSYWTKSISLFLLFAEHENWNESIIRHLHLDQLWKFMNICDEENRAKPRGAWKGSIFFRNNYHKLIFILRFFYLFNSFVKYRFQCNECKLGVREKKSKIYSHFSYYGDIRALEMICYNWQRKFLAEKCKWKKKKKKYMKISKNALFNHITNNFTCIHS